MTDLEAVTLAAENTLRELRMVERTETALAIDLVTAAFSLFLSELLAARHIMRARPPQDT